MPKSAIQNLKSLIQIINRIGSVSSMPFFYQHMTTHTPGIPVDPDRATNQTIIDSTAQVRYSKNFIHENIGVINRPNAQGIQEVPFTFNLQVLKQQYWLEQTLRYFMHGNRYYIYPHQQMNARLQSLIYTAMLKLEELAQGKIKFYETNTVGSGPVLFIENCGRSVDDMYKVDSYYANIQLNDNFAYRSWICLRQSKNDQDTLGTILHELLHALGVKELRNHHDAVNIVKQLDGGHSSVMFYDEDRLNSQHYNRRRFLYDYEAAFLGQIDKELINEIAQGETSFDIQDVLASTEMLTHFLRQYAISLCSASVFAFLTHLKNNNKKMFDKNTAQFIANVCAIMLMYYLDTATEAIVLQVIVTLIQSICTLLSPRLGSEHAFLLELFMLPVSGLCIAQQLKLFYTQNTCELLGKWSALTIATLMGNLTGGDLGKITATYLPGFNNTISTGSLNNHEKINPPKKHKKK